MNITRRLKVVWSEFSQRDAFVFGRETVRYSALEKAVDRFAATLQKEGVQRGDRVALILSNTPEFIYSYYGVLKVGAVAVSLNPRLQTEELLFLISDCDPKRIVTTSEVRHRLTQSCNDLPSFVDDQPLELDDSSTGAVDLSPESPAAIVYTSGTTGTPRGAVLSHANLIFNAESKVSCMGIRPDDRLLLFLPLFHCFGQNAIMNSALLAGASLVLHRSFALEEIRESLVRNKITMFFGVPATYSLLLEMAQPSDLEGVRYFFSAAAPLAPEVESRWMSRFGKPIYQGYGLTETSPFAAYNHLRQHRVGSIGSPIPGVDMRVASASTHQEADVDELGEIQVKGPNVMLGYWRRDEETREVLRDGWFSTGDIGRRDKDGYFFLHDRIKDMINTGGQKVYPAEVERVLYEHPDVVEAAVFGVHDPVFGETVAARVRVRQGSFADAITLRNFCRKHLASYKTPRDLRIVDEIPKSPSGKILKRVLREDAAQEKREAVLLQGRPDRRVLTTEHIERWLLDWMADEHVNPQTSFLNLGLSSLDMVVMVEQLAEYTGIALPASLPWSYPTVAQLAARVTELMPVPVRHESSTDSLRAIATAVGWSKDDNGKEETDFTDIADLLRQELELSGPLLQSARTATVKQ